MTHTVFIASDHAGVSLKEYLVNQNELDLINLGPYSNDSVDYPRYAKLLCDNSKSEINKGANDTNVRGILICGSGIGMSICANRHPWIRAALCCDKNFAELSRQHNNANVLILPARFITNDAALKIVKTFLDVPFEGGRHQRRIDMI